MQRSLEVCQRLLAAHKASELSRVVMVGGPTMMPWLRRMVYDSLHATLTAGLDPMTLVAQGAALRAHIHAGRLQSALALCDEWLAKNGEMPLHAAAAMALAERLRAAVKTLPKGPAPTATSALAPRPLSK